MDVKPSLAAAAPTAQAAPSYNLLARLATALVLSPIVVAVVCWSDPRGLAALAAMASSLALWEFLAVMEAPAGERLLGIALALAMGGALYAHKGWLGALPLVLVVICAFYLFRCGGEVKRAAAGMQRMLFGILYVGLLLFVVLLKRDMGARGGAWVLLLLSMAWVGDALAYAAGRWLGTHKLYPAVSPSKSWEGAIGGLVGSALAATLAHFWYLPEIGPADVAWLALPASVLGQIGDLCESVLKRAQGVKDSGCLLPGHGGMLDRVDALLFMAPYVYFYATWR